MTCTTTRHLLLIVVTTALAVILYQRHAQSTNNNNNNTSEILPPTSMASTAPQQTVIVVGAGLAGLSASYAALRAGAAVRLLERADKPGGNSIKASSGINGAPTRFQQGAADTAFYSDTARSAGARLASSADSLGRQDREALIAKLTGSSAAAIDFLAADVGVDLSVVAQLGGHSVARTHRGGSGALPPGAAIVTALLDRLKQDPSFELRTGCEVTRLLTSAAGDHRAVTGVEYRHTTGAAAAAAAAAAGEERPATLLLDGASVVFTTGGFAGDTAGLLARCRPDLAGLPSTNDARPGAHRVLQAVGARLVDMDSVQVHPTGFVAPADPRARVKFLAAEMLRGEGGILLHEGRRFVNEMETREHVSRVIMASLPPSGSRVGGGDDDDDADDDGPTQWDVQLLLDPGACDAAASHIGFYLWKGLLSKVKVKDLDATRRQTIREYSQVVAGSGGRVDALGRTAFGAWRLTGTAADDEQDVCVGRVTPVTHFTMGGAAINASGQVLAGDEGQAVPVPVPGLWAAGEITGGLHGDNRLGGSSLLECVVFGQTAGREAAVYAANRASST